MSRIKQLISFFVFTVILCSTQLTFGQVNASLNGVVTDQNGSPLPGANIIAVHQPSGTQYGTTSREDGRYNLQGLRVGGPYKVTVSFVGYTPQTEEGFNLALDQDLRIDFKLPEQAVTLSGITVTAESNAVMSAARTGAALNVSAKQIQEVPTINRTLQDLAKLSPFMSGTGLNVAGRSNRYNNIQIDGTQYNDLFGLGSTGTAGGQTGANPISLDAIDQFQVVIAPYDVRQSGFTGGGINSITRSGTNTYSGSGYFYGRNQNLVGQYNADGVRRAKLDDFKEYQGGFRFGGPIIPDKLFFFVNGEITGNPIPYTNPSVISGYGGKTPDEIKALADRFKADLAAKGFSAGSYDNVTLSRPSTKLFVKFDYNLSANHKLTLRNNYVSSYAEKFYTSRLANRLVFDSEPYKNEETTNSTVLILNSTFGNSLSNELIVGYTLIRNKRKGIVGALPTVQVNEINRTFQMWAGPDRYSSANRLDQDVLEFTDNLSFYMGNHTVTVGTHNEYFKFLNLFARSAFGYYVYNSLDDFEADNIYSYQRVYSLMGDPKDPNAILPAEFSVFQFGFYAQDEWTVNPQFKVTYGLRVDIPTFPDKPAVNSKVPQYFPGYQTDQIPSGNLLWSPRVGFNYDISGDRTTQIRGGIGVFTGRIPYVWMSNNFGNTGTTAAEVSYNYRSGKTMPFRADPYNQYVPLDTTYGTSSSTTSEIDLVDPNVKLPQVMRFDIGIDHQLPLGFLGTAEFLYSKNLNDMLYRKVNLLPPTGIVATVGGAADGRNYYGGTNSGGGNFYNILELYNTSGGYQYNLVFQVQRNVAEGFSVNAGYALGQSKDKNSLASSQANSQMAYSPIDNDPNNPALATSDYQIHDRVFASVTYTHEFFQDAPTSISLFYNGQTGKPFSYIIYGDLNNDGFNQNDLFYIPKNNNEILLGSISSGQFVRNEQMYSDLNSFINNDKYLSSHKGQIAERNGENNPWSEYLDMRITQDIPDLWGMGRFQVSMDFLNLPNLLGEFLNVFLPGQGYDEWGVSRSTAYNTYTIVSLKGMINYNGQANTPVYSFSKPTGNTPFTPNDYSSRWALQLGIRYSF